MSCLFNSLEYFLNITSSEIRSKICDFLENNKKIFDGIDTKDLLELESDNYVKKMRKNSTWGGAIEIKTACNIWNLEIIVCNIRNGDKNGDKNDSQIQFIPNNGIDRLTKKIYITWNGFHYEPVRNKQNKDNKNINIHNSLNIDSNDSNKINHKNKKHKKKYEILNKKNNKDKGDKGTKDLFDLIFDYDKKTKNKKVKKNRK